MPTERAEHQAWADAQRDALLELGYDIADVQARIQWVLDNLPPGADPATHVFQAHELWQELSAPAQVQDSRVAWIANDEIAPRWKLLLDARAESEDA